MATNDLINLAAIRKILNINDTVDDPDLQSFGEIANDDVETDIAEYVDSETLSGEDLAKAIKLCTLLTAAMFKNGKNNKEQTKFYMDLYEKGLKKFKNRKLTKPASARKISTTTRAVSPLHFQLKRL